MYIYWLLYTYYGDSQMKGKDTKITGFETQRLLKNGLVAIVKYGLIQRGNYEGEGTTLIVLGAKPEDLKELFVGE